MYRLLIFGSRFATSRMLLIATIFTYNYAKRLGKIADLWTDSGRA